MKNKSELIYPTDAEEDAINQGIASDPDNSEITDAEFSRMDRAVSSMPDLVQKARRIRGPQKTPVKIPVSMRLDSDLVEALKAGGPGWQSRANDALRRALALS